MTKHLAKKNHSLLLFFFALTMVLSAREAKAYLDPGTGTIIIQGVIAAVVGSIVAIKMYWMKIRAFMARKSKSKTETRQGTEK